MKNKYSLTIGYLAAAGLLAAGTLNAGVVVSNPNTTVNVTDSSLYFQINGNSVTGADYGLYSGTWKRSCAGFFAYCGSGADDTSSYLNERSSSGIFFIGKSTVSVGATISSTAYTTWYSNTDSIARIIDASGTYYVPFYETVMSAGGDKTYYGYLELSYVRNSTLSLVGGAIENTGGAITVRNVASAVPEPATCGAVLGVAALAGAAWKRWKSRA